jgi:hypothetical protein
MPEAGAEAAADPDPPPVRLLYLLQQQVEQVHRVQLLVVAATATLADPMEAIVAAATAALSVLVGAVVDQATARRQEQQPRLQVALVAMVLADWP